MAPSLSVSECFKTKSCAVTYPLQTDETHLRHTFNGSAALYQAAVDMQLQANDAVLLPAYCCGAELGPFELLGCELLFYDIHSNLRVDIEQINTLLIQRSDIRMILITHYLGVPQPDVTELEQICRAKNVTLLEDCAHALYGQLDGKPLGSFGNYAIFSPRKSLPLTEGGMLLAKHGLRPALTETMTSAPHVPALDRLCYSAQQGLRSQQPQGFVMSILTILAIALWAVPAVIAKLVKSSGLLPYGAWLSPEVEGSEIVFVKSFTSSRLTRRIMHSSNDVDIVQKRRNNHAIWVDLLTDFDEATVLMDTLPDGCCPLYFAVSVADPAYCVAALSEYDIEAFNWWQHMNTGIDWQQYPVSRRLKQRLIALPVHQQLTNKQIQFMATTLKQIITDVQ